MMPELLAQITAGALLGLAGGLHCACMCGGLTATTVSLFCAKSKTQGAATISMVMVGRVCAYVILGALAAAGAGFLSGLLAVPAPSNVMVLIGAAALIWIGFSTAGLLPALSSTTTLTGANSTVIAPLTSQLQRLQRKIPRAAPLVIGLSWGFAPCPLLYAALFLAMLTGSWLGGAGWMFGFGLGTLPPVLLSALGINWLGSLSVKTSARTAIGLTVAGLGFATAYFDLGLFEGLC